MTLRNLSPAELIGWIDQTPLKEQHITGLHYNPLTNTFKLAPGVDVNYMLHTTAKKHNVIRFMMMIARHQAAQFSFRRRNQHSIKF